MGKPILSSLFIGANEVFHYFWRWIGGANKSELFLVAGYPILNRLPSYSTLSGGIVPCLGTHALYS